MKTCVICSIDKPDDQFFRWMRRCKECHNAICRANYRKNAEHVKQRVKIYDATRPERTAYQREYAKSHFQRNKPLHNARGKQRRAIQRRAMPAWANTELIKEYYFAADLLSMCTGEWYHVDHVVPLQSELVCGLHWEGNMQILTGPENISKGNRFWPDMP
jgi:hypothetical protein